MRIDEAHAIALHLLVVPRPPAVVVSRLGELDEHTRELVWTRQPGDPADVEAFAAKLPALSALCAGLTIPELNDLLGLLGYEWRSVPVPLLLLAGRHLADSPQSRLCRLEVSHVAAWAKETKPTDSTLPANFANAVEAALNWESCDVIELLRRPESWTNQCPGIKVAGHVLVPLVSSAQLADLYGTRSRHLCSVRHADAMKRGHAAWWLCYPEFQGGRPGCIGLERSDLGADWALAADPVPPPELRPVARSVLAQAESKVRRTRTARLISETRRRMREYIHRLCRFDRGVDA